MQIGGHRANLIRKARDIVGERLERVLVVERSKKIPGYRHQTLGGSH